ncbi:acyltransferase [Pengzhenrongella frigida]|uniref:Acyltransferase n=1 Tax=Pengzhenrongella frigida TaxID=1259133 RepID=A0A4Q5N028_9MICO|nr:acyltransferase [Cellulomonas sp. HLT2-17]
MSSPPGCGLTCLYAYSRSMPLATLPTSAAPPPTPLEARHTPRPEREKPAAPPRRARLGALDALRFFAAMAVLIYHFTVRNSQAWGRPPAEVFPNAGEWLMYGALGPELFLVISGFVILMTAWDRSVANVAASRIARLFPAYWSGVLLTGALLLWIWPGGKNVTAGEVAVNLTMLQSLFDVGNVDGVYWTLWAELRFYVLIVVFVAIGITRRRVLAFAALWPGLALVADAAGPGWLRTVLVAEYAPLFAIGMLLFLIRREGHSARAWWLVAANTAAAVWLVVPDQLVKQLRNTDHAPSALVLGLLVVACVALVVVVTLTPVSRLDWRWLTTLGALTYPLYLVHEHWGWWIISNLTGTLPPYLVLALATAFSLALAAGIHFGVERRVGPRLRSTAQAGLERAGDVARGLTAGQGVGRPPTGPAGRVPARIAAKNAGDVSGSSCTVEPMSPGR